MAVGGIGPLKPMLEMRKVFPWCSIFHMNLTFPHSIRKDFLCEKDNDLSVNKWCAVCVQWTCLFNSLGIEQSFSNFIVYSDPLGLLLKCRFWLRRSVEPRVEPETHISNQLLGVAVAAAEQWIFWVAKGYSVKFIKDLLMDNLICFLPKACELSIVISTLKVKKLRVWLEIATIFKCQTFLGTQL